MRSLIIAALRSIYAGVKLMLANLIWKQIDSLHKRKQQADAAIVKAQEFAKEVEKDCQAYKEVCTARSAKLLAEVADL